jgi:hypothetical protein
LSFCDRFISVEWDAAVSEDGRQVRHHFLL